MCGLEKQHLEWRNSRWPMNSFFRITSPGLMARPHLEQTAGALLLDLLVSSSARVSPFRMES
jgi:hypothetical protein